MLDLELELELQKVEQVLQVDLALVVPEVQVELVELVEQATKEAQDNNLQVEMTKNLTMMIQVFCEKQFKIQVTFLSMTLNDICPDNFINN